MRIETEALRQAWVDHIADGDWDWFLTLNLNQYSSRTAARTHFKRFCQYLDRDLLGPRYLRKQEQRVDIYALSEHIHSNLHLHCFVQFRRRRPVSEPEAEQAIEVAWKRTIPSGTTDLRDLHSPRGAAHYALKEMWNTERLDDIMHSRDFWSAS